MEQFGLYVVLIVLALVLALVLRYPVIRTLVINRVFKSLLKNEALIVQYLYNNLPSTIKKNVDSKTFAEVVGLVLSEGIKSVEKEIKGEIDKDLVRK